MRGRARIARALELLEPRQLLAASYPTALEQYHVELINRGRADPATEAARLGLGPDGINEGPVKSGGVPIVLPDGARQPLAVNPYLMDAAQKYALDILAAGTLDHYLNGTTPADRGAAAGYSGGLAGYENLAFMSGQLSQATVETNYNNLFRDYIPGGVAIDGRGHRRNLLNPDLTEIGVGNAVGSASYTVEDMARGPTYLTGVVFSDTRKVNSFYTPGEGIGGITITAIRQDSQQFMTTTWAAGGYSLPLDDGTYTVIASGGSLPAPITFNDITVAGQNRKVDFVLGALPAAPPDLVVEATSLVGPDTFVPGDKGKLGVTVTNLMGDSASGKITITAYLSSDFTLDPSADIPLGSLAVAKFVSGPAGTTKSLSVPTSIPFTTLPGVYHVLVTLTSDAITESNETNNTSIGGDASVVWQAGTVGGRENVTLRWSVPGSTATNTLKLTGGGTATVTPDGNAVRIFVADTTASSALTLSTPKGTSVQVSGITATSSMKAIAAKTAGLVGDLMMHGSLGSLSVQQISGGHALSADAIGTLSIAGDISDTTISLLAAGLDPSNTKAFALNRMTVSGKANNLLLRSSGNINSITIGAAAHVTVFAGVSPLVDTIPDTADDFTRDLRINSFVIKGLATEPFDTADVLLSAATIGKVALVDIQTANSGVPFGLAMHTLGSLTRAQNSAKTTWTSKQAQGLLSNDGDLTYNFI